MHGERQSMNKKICLTIFLLFILTTSCVRNTPSPMAPNPTPQVEDEPTESPSSTPPPTPTDSRLWVEEEITFNFGTNDLYGILTVPSSEGPHPAIVLISGSVDPSTGARAGASANVHVNHAHKMVLDGFAVLRYDPPGVGQSTGERGFESLDVRTEEAIAALRYMQSRPDIQQDRIGLWGGSQGAWVIAMAAAGYPQDVAFIISVSGSGVSVAEQQIYSIEAQSEDAGFSEKEIAKAVLIGRLMIDWQLTDPIYQEVNEAEAQALGEGPWTSFMGLVYESGDITPAEELQQVIEILKSIQEEPWVKFLFLKELYIPQLESIPPDQILSLKAVAGESLLIDPKDYLPQIQCPVLVIFGEKDLLQPTERSAALYEQYLTEGGNENFTIVVIPGVGHSLGGLVSTYWEAISDWLGNLYSE